MFSCRMMGLRYELILLSRPEKDVLYPPLNLDAFGDPQKPSVYPFTTPGIRDVVAEAVEAVIF